MTLKHLRIFRAVYEEQSVTRASEKLFMTQPAVTRAVKELESHYGVLLFERLNHRIYPTAGADALYRYVLHLLETMEGMEQSMREQEERGLLRVGASVTIGNYDLPDIVSRLKAERPGLRIQARIASGGTLEELLLRNELDAALIEGFIGRTELVQTAYGEDVMQLIVPPNHPLLRKTVVTLADVAACDLLLREKGSAGRAFIDSVFMVQGFEPRPAWESMSTQALVQGVAHGLGVAILPEKLVREDVRAGRVAACAIADVSLRRKLFLVHHGNKFLTPAIRRFGELAAETQQGASLPPAD